MTADAVLAEAARSVEPKAGALQYDPTLGQERKSADQLVASLDRAEALPKRQNPKLAEKITAKVLLLQLAPSIHSLGDLDGKSIAIRDLTPNLQIIASNTFESLGLAPTFHTVDVSVEPEQLLAGDYAATLVMLDADRAPKRLAENMLRLQVDPWIVSLKSEAPAPQSTDH